MCSASSRFEPVRLAVISAGKGVQLIPPDSMLEAVEDAGWNKSDLTDGSMLSPIALYRSRLRINNPFC